MGAAALGTVAAVALSGSGREPASYVPGGLTDNQGNSVFSSQYRNSLKQDTNASSQSQEESTRHEALNDAKRDANVPTSQQPDKQENVPVTDANGKQVVKDGKPQTSREYTHTTGEGKKVVIQDHRGGHEFPDGGKKDSHFNVRPPDDKRNGKVPGTKPHYPYKDHN